MLVLLIDSGHATMNGVWLFSLFSFPGVLFRLQIVLYGDSIQWSQMTLLVGFVVWMCVYYVMWCDVCVKGGVATLITMPLDVMKTRMMNAPPGTYSVRPATS